MPEAARHGPRGLPTKPIVCLGAQHCGPITTMAPYIASRGGWLAALPNASLIEQGRTNCLLCDEPSVKEAMRCSDKYPREIWNLAGAVSSVSALAPGLNWSTPGIEWIAAFNKFNLSGVPLMHGMNHWPWHFNRPGWVPDLMTKGQSLHVRDGGWRWYTPRGRMSNVLPCSSARGEDAAVIRTFFTHNKTANPLRGGTFLEIGGYDGVLESQSWILEGCHGWRGVLVEPHPTSFNLLRRQRPASLNVHMAACLTAGAVGFSAEAGTASNAHSGGAHIAVPCAPLGGVLASLGVDAIDFASVDVEGSELTVLRSLLSRHDRPSLGVVLVEVRMDGQREPIMELMLGAGLRYVGQITGRPSPANEVISDCFVNLTHVATRFGASRAFVRGDATRPTGRSCPRVPTWWFQGLQPKGYGGTAPAPAGTGDRILAAGPTGRASQRVYDLKAQLRASRDVGT